MASAKENYRVELRAAVRQLGDRCLYTAAKWSAELLVGIEPDAAPSQSAAMDTPSSSGAGGRLLHLHRSGGSSFRRRMRPAASEAGTPLGGVSYVSTPIPDDDAFDAGADKYLLAKTYFDCREYRRAAHVLRGHVGRKAVFLRCYALYMAGEKRKEEETIELEGSLGKSNVVNKELVALERELSTHRRTGAIDSFGLYLYGIVLRDKGCEGLARTVLVESVNSYPWNWCAWLEIQSLCTTSDILNNLNLKNHWMKDFFIASAHLELKMHEEALKRYERLMGVFRCSDYIQAQIATVQYSMRELDDADMIFEELLRTDPFRVDSMDIYSNLLYAKESLTALSFLAHRVFLTDKYRPESCCIIANYYSLKGQHEKSVLYFQRALKLNRKYLSAWTLMGHEFVELKNTPAAIDAYRRAVDINPRDYRAWYGLGQIYEMMGMPFYALYYFRKSSHLQPNDARLWIAMAQCYESDPLQMIEEAIKCYERAANSNDTEGIALHQLAKLHSMLGQSEEAAFYYKKDLERMEVEERQGQNFVEALLFLAKHCKSVGRFEEAEHYCTRLLDYTGPEKETAKSILQGLKRAQSGFPSMDIDHFAIEANTFVQGRKLQTRVFMDKEGREDRLLTPSTEKISKGSPPDETGVSNISSRGSSSNSPHTVMVIVCSLARRLHTAGVDDLVRMMLAFSCWRLATKRTRRLHGAKTSVMGMIQIASSSIGIADWFLLGCQISMAFLRSTALVCVASPAVACIYV